MRWRARGKYCMRMRSLQRGRYDVLYHTHRPNCHYRPVKLHLVYFAFFSMNTTYEFPGNYVIYVILRNHLNTLVYCSRPRHIYIQYIKLTYFPDAA